MSMLTAILFILVLVVLIISHEFGHFIAAKLFGVQVDEFGLGFPPKIIGKKYGETEYTLNWLPFGGFVKIVGEDDPVEVRLPDSRSQTSTGRSFGNQPVYKKILILTAGVIANMLLAWFLFFVSLQTGLLMPTEGVARPEYLTNSRVVVGYVLDGSPAQKAGITEGDQVVTTSPDEVISLVGASEGKPVTVTVIHAGKKESVSVIVTPQADKNGIYKIGVALSELGEAHLPFLAALGESASMTRNLTQATAVGLYQFATGIFAKESTVGAVSGPVGIFGMVGSARDMGFAYVLAFMALLSINLAVLNILPIPALDGGRVLFIIIETIKGSPLSPKFTQNVHSIGFTLLIILMLLITAHDVVKLF